MAAMEGRGIEPASKRQRLGLVLYTLNTQLVQMFDKLNTDNIIAQMAQELQFTKATMVMHKGVKLGLFDKIPVTSEGDPLHFLTEVGKFF